MIKVLFAYDLLIAIVVTVFFVFSGVHPQNTEVLREYYFTTGTILSFILGVYIYLSHRLLSDKVVKYLTGLKKLGQVKTSFRLSLYAVTVTILIAMIAGSGVGYDAASIQTIATIFVFAFTYSIGACIYMARDFFILAFLNLSNDVY